MAKNLETIKAEVEGMVQEINKAIANNNLQDFNIANVAATELIKEYTAMSKNITFNALKESGNPMIEALKNPYFETLKITKNDDDTKGIDTVSKKIDLKDLHKFCGGIGEDKNWIYTAEKVNQLLAARRAVGQGTDPTEILSSFYMKDISRQIKLGKTPTSNTKALELINLLVAQMIGKVGKATKFDLTVLDGDYAKATGDMLTRKAATNTKFIEIMMTICHRIVTNGSYKLECKLKK